MTGYVLTMSKMTLPLHLNLNPNLWSKPLLAILIGPDGASVAEIVARFREIKAKFAVLVVNENGSSIHTASFSGATAEPSDKFSGHELDTIAIWVTSSDTLDADQYLESYSVARVILAGSREDTAGYAGRHGLHVIFQDDSYSIAKRLLNDWEANNRSIGNRMVPVSCVPAQAFVAHPGQDCVTLCSEVTIAPQVTDYATGQDIKFNDLQAKTGYFEGQIARSSNVVFHAGTGILFDLKGNVCSDTAHWVMWQQGDLPSHLSSAETGWRTWKVRDFVVDSVHDKPVFTLATRFPNNYFHWFHDLGPKIWLYDTALKSGLITAPIPFLLGHAPAAGFQEEFLRCLKIPGQEILISGEEFTLLRHAYFACFRDNNQELIQRSRPLAYYEWLRDAVSTAIDRTYAAREAVYISRADTVKRRLLNEDEVIARLRDRGFDILTPGKMTFSQQVSALRAAKVVVGPHGAGLCNAAFSVLGSSLGEIRTEVNDEPSYRYISQFRKSRYYSLRAEVAPNDDPNPINHDMRLSLDLLNRFVDEVFQHHGIAG